MTELSLSTSQSSVRIGRARFSRFARLFFFCVNAAFKLWLPCCEACCRKCLLDLPSSPHGKVSSRRKCRNNWRLVLLNVHSEMIHEINDMSLPCTVIFLVPGRGRLFQFQLDSTGCRHGDGVYFCEGIPAGCRCTALHKTWASQHIDQTQPNRICEIHTNVGGIFK